MASDITMTDLVGMTVNELWEEVEHRLGLLEVVGGRLFERNTVKVWCIEFQIRSYLARIDRLLLEIESRKSMEGE